MECLSSFVGGDNTWRIVTAYTLFLLTNKDDHLTGDSCFVDSGAFGTEMATMSTCFVSTAMTDLELSFLNSLVPCDYKKAFEYYSIAAAKVFTTTPTTPTPHTLLAED